MSTPEILKIFLNLNLVLIQFNAAIDYRCLPRVIERNARPSSDPARVLAIGKISIALMVGVYTLAALFCNSADSVWCSILLSIYLSADTSWAAKKYLRQPATKPNAA